MYSKLKSVKFSAENLMFYTAYTAKLRIFSVKTVKLLVCEKPVPLPRLDVYPHLHTTLTYI